MENSQQALEKLRHEFRNVELAHRVVTAVQVNAHSTAVDLHLCLQDNELVKQEYGENLGDIIQSTFIPEGHLLYHNRQKIGLTRSTTPPDDTLSREAAEELRQKTYWMLSKSNSNSSRQNHLSYPSMSSTSEFLHSRRDSILEETAEDIGQNLEKSREEYLRDLLCGSSELPEEGEKLPDFDLGDPPLGFIP